METFILIISTIISFLVGLVWGNLHLHKKAIRNGCPFKNACLKYDDVETKIAIKRVLTLLIQNEVPKEEIQEIINKTLYENFNGYL